MCRKLVQTDQGYQLHQTPDRFGHLQAKILITFENGPQTHPLKRQIPTCMQIFAWIGLK